MTDPAMRCQRVLNALHSLLPVSYGGTRLFSTRCSFFVAGGLILLLQACAAVPPAADLPSKAVPKLNLNLPGQDDANCACGPEVQVDRTFLDKGFSTLAEGDYREAVNYFRRYQRLESSPSVDWEANIAVAYVKMMPKSPYYNSKTATESYRRLMREQPQDTQLPEKILIMRDALAVFVRLHVQVDDLQNEQDVLIESLEKREEALKRLRELTLGQKAAVP